MDNKISKPIIYKERIQNIFKRVFTYFIRSKKTEFQNRDRLASFNTIYKEKRWGDDNLSGGGSSVEFTKNTREVIYKIIKDFNCNSMLDVACGDFKWMPILLERLESNFKYIGCDIVQNLILQHKLLYPKYDFYHVDFVRDKLPTCDLIICRDALQHLPIDDIKKALDNFSTSGSKYLLATTHIRYPKWKNKRDIRVGQCRDRNLLLEPFSLEDPIVIYSDSQISHKFLGLWKLPLKYNH
jgi:SAM-dependent methyltransferase